MPLALSLSKDPPPMRTERWLDHCLDRCLAWRDRLLASPVFQRRAAAFALTRPTARRHARALFDLVAGFVYSQTLRACVELDVFERLAKGPSTLAELAAQLALPVEGARRLLDAAVALHLLEHRRPRAGEPRYGLGRLGAPMVGNAAVRAMVLHHAALYADMADPVALLRASATERAGNALARYWAYEAAPAPCAAPCAASSADLPIDRSADPSIDPSANPSADRSADPSATPSTRERIATYSALMAASQPLVADQILDAYPLQHHRCLLDVGGGDGRFIVAACGRAPALRAVLFDLPVVAAQGAARFAAEGLGDRTRVQGGSFLGDPLPTGADIASLVRVVHDHDDVAALTLLRAVCVALPPGGTLLLAEPMAATPGAEAMGDAYFGLYLFAMGRGRPRTAERLGAMLRETGFEAVRELPTDLPMQTRLLVARRPG